MTQGQKTTLIVIGIVLLVILIPFGYLKGTYNSLVRMDEGIKGAWAQVENQLQRRYDLIPNYVETVKGYAKHEKEVFLKVTQARSKVAGAGAISEKIAANNQLSSALARLLVVVERYPENRISVERRRFNEAVKVYNIKIRSFPTNFIAGMFGFEKATFFEVPKEKQEVPKVKF